MTLLFECAKKENELKSTNDLSMFLKKIDDKKDEDLEGLIG